MPARMPPISPPPAAIGGSRTNDEDHALDRLKRVFQHQALHLAVVAASPILARQEGPANFDHAAIWIVTVEARRSDDSAGGAIDCDQRAARTRASSKNARNVGSS